MVKIKSVEEKVMSVFINEIQCLPEFTEKEITRIDSVIKSSLTTDKMVNELAKVIGGFTDENS